MVMTSRFRRTCTCPGLLEARGPRHRTFPPRIRGSPRFERKTCAPLQISAPLAGVARMVLIMADLPLMRVSRSLPSPSSSSPALRPRRPRLARPRSTRGPPTVSPGRAARVASQKAPVAELPRRRRADLPSICATAVITEAQAACPRGKSCVDLIAAGGAPRSPRSVPPRSAPASPSGPTSVLAQLTIAAAIPDATSSGAPTRARCGPRSSTSPVRRSSCRRRPGGALPRSPKRSTRP